MILRFKSMYLTKEKTGNVKNDCIFLNIDTDNEEFSYGVIREKNYITISVADYESLLQEMDFHCYARVKYLRTDRRLFGCSVTEEEALPFN